jgi:DNA-binding NtrC family response regulator
VASWEAVRIRSILLEILLQRLALDMNAVSYNFAAHMQFEVETLADYSSQLIEQRLIGISGWAQSARSLILRHASHDNIVNLEGEPGAGKSLVAELIHQCSARREGPFVILKFTSVAVDVIRSVLFGSTLARSTQDFTDQKGLIELASEGTLYIEGLFQSAGSSSLVEDVLNPPVRSRFDYLCESGARILLGWNVQPRSRPPEAVNGRENLRDFETVAIPPLRERPEDVEALVLHFVKDYCLQTKRELRTVSPEALDSLRSYDWPQNVSEIKALVMNLVGQASPAAIDRSLLPSYISARRDGPRTLGDGDLFPASGIDLCNEIRGREVELICAALKHSRGMQANAARLLHIKPTTLFMKIQRYGINVEAFR